MATVGKGKVYLEGVEIKNATGCNVAEGWVDCWTESPSGYCNKDIVIDAPLESRLYGFVEFVPADVGAVKTDPEWLWSSGGDRELQFKGKPEPEAHTVANLVFDIDYSGVTQATEHMNKLADAIERVEAARSGPVEYAAVGDVYTIRFGVSE